MTGACRNLYTMPTPLQDYFAQRVKHLFETLDDLALNRDEASLHDLRVEMKKCKAMIRFLRVVYAKQKLTRSSEKLSVVFHRAGDIREYQLMHQWLVNSGLASMETRYFPKKEIARLLNRFYQDAKKHKQVFTKVVDAMKEYIETTNQQLAEQYVKYQRALIKNHIRLQPGSHNWHTLRKLIKQWIYAVNWIGDADRKKIYTEVQQYDKLQEAIGSWHDQQLIRDTLSEKKIHFSENNKLQKLFGEALLKLNRSIRYREKKIGSLLYTITPYKQ